MPESKGETSLPRDVLERSGHVYEYHRSSKLCYPAPAGSKPPDPRLRPSSNRIFDPYPKTALPISLLSPSLPTLSLLHEGLSAVPESHLKPPQDLKTLASLLHSANGMIDPARGFRSCVSNGQLYPCEIYVVALSIEGLPSGLYHFSPAEFSLRKLREGPEALAQLKRGRPDLEFVKTMPAVFLISSIFCRSTWKFAKRGYRCALLDSGHQLQNLVTCAVGLGILPIVRQYLNDGFMRELIGVSPEADFPDAEAVQALVVWGDRAKRPMMMPSGFALSEEPLPSIPRHPLAAQITSYGSILAAYDDSVAAGVAVHDVRPPLTELSPLAQKFPSQSLPVPEAPDGGELLNRVLHKALPIDDFLRHSIPRDQLWNINRLAFRGGSFPPITPEEIHVGLLRPFWILSNVTGMENGLWYYHPHKDVWSLISPGDHHLEMQFLALENPACGNASAQCFMVANLQKLLLEGGPDLYRLIHIEAGAIGQRLSLAAGAMGLVTMPLGGFYDEEVRKFLGLQKTGWEPIYGMALGMPIPLTDANAEPSDGADLLWRG